MLANNTTEPTSANATEEQRAILNKIKGTTENLFVRARAGTGKSTTLEMVQEIAREEPLLYLVFAKSDREKAEAKQAEKEARGIKLKTMKVQTLNSCGHGILGKTIGKKLTIDTKHPKMHDIVRNLINEYKGQDKSDAWEEYHEIVAASSMAKHLGYIPDGRLPYGRRLCDRDTLSARLESPLTDLGWEVVDNALFASIKAANDGLIDFDDQVFMPAVFGGAFPRYPHVLVDEWQDLSPANHAMLARLISSAKSRVTGVGDECQSIYYFRGADTTGVAKGIEKFKMTVMPLTVSFRCAKVIVESARWRVPDFKWIIEGGRYEKLQRLDPDTIIDGAAIVCRNNAPLLKCAFALLSRKRSVQIAGSDIGPKIVRLLKKIGSEKDSQEDLLFKIDAWREAKLATANAPDSISDQAECLKVFATWGANLEQAIAYANHIFEQHGAITLTTGHKAKGKEWDVVYLLDPWLLKQDEQDLNLKYVMQTRAKQEVYEIDGRSIEW